MVTNTEQMARNSADAATVRAAVSVTRCTDSCEEPWAATAEVTAAPTPRLFNGTSRISDAAKV